MLAARLLACSSSLAAALGGGGTCAALNGCSGHGSCLGWPPSCLCDAGWGAAGDVTAYRAPDCSARSCPWAGAWADVPRGARRAHAPAECAGAGLCNRETGACRCFAGYAGEACARSTCPGAPACSAHGRCLPMAELARGAAGSVAPLAFGGGGGGNFSGGGAHNGSAGDGDETAGGAGWDAQRVYGCACDSAWPVGYGAGAVQAPQWAGADCSEQRCPSGDDPRTPANETDCEWCVVGVRVRARRGARPLPPSLPLQV